MRNIPGKTLILIAVLVTITIALLGLAIWAGMGKKPITVNTFKPTPTAIEKTATVYFSPSDLDLSESATPTASVNVMVNTENKPITGAQIEIVYDPNVITNVRFVQPDSDGSLFGPSGTYSTLFTDTSSRGKLTFAQAINPNGNPVTGTGSVGVISFSVVRGASPSSALNFGNGTIVTSQGVQQSVLKSATPLNIKLN